MFTSLHPPTRVYRGCRTSPHFTATSLVWEFYWSVSFGGILVALFHFLKRGLTSPEGMAGRVLGSGVIPVPPHLHVQ